MANPERPNELQRGLKNRHIQLIALGGAVGAGLFYGIAPTIHQAGPSVLLGYAVAGFIAFLIMRQLSEMVVEEPVSGSFSYFADKYWGKFAGYLSGWNYWILYILVGMSELTACGKAIRALWPEVDIWLSVLIIFIIINAINLSAVKIYGEAEFWFAIIKVLTIVCIILWGTYLLVSGNGGEQASLSNLWAYGGFFPNGTGALLMSMTIIMFSFGGLELLGITAAEADNPEKSIPKATNQVLIRILLFYIGSIVILLCLFPWTTIEASGDKSPFVKMFYMMDSHVVGVTLNFVIFTAALSAYNSDAYCTGRMLYGLAKQGHAPKSLIKINHKGAPQRAILVSAVITVLCVGINYFMSDALIFLMALVVAALVLNWILITLTHLKFRKEYDRRGIKTKFAALIYPWGNYITLAFLGGILFIMAISFGKADDGSRTIGLLQMAVMMIPIWLAFLAVGYLLIDKKILSSKS
jgi:aromatic amino acid transport protein AroP